MTRGIRLLVWVAYPIRLSLCSPVSSFRVSTPIMLFNNFTEDFVLRAVRFFLIRRCISESRILRLWA